MEIQTIILPIIALILSGLVWTTFGAFSNWRKNHDTAEWQGFDFAKLRKNVILGAVLGIGTIIYVFITDGDLTPITSVQAFFVSIGAGFGLVSAVDKFIIGGVLGK